MKTLKYIALSLLVAASTTACKDDPELLTTDVGPEMTIVSADASGVYGGKVDFEVTMTDRYALSTLKAQVFFDDEMVAEEVIRTKSDGTYTGAVTLPFYKNIPDGEATLRFVGQNVRFGTTTVDRPLAVSRPKPAYLTFFLDDAEYRMEPTGNDYEYAVTDEFPQKPQGYIATPELGGDLRLRLRGRRHRLRFHRRHSLRQFECRGVHDHLQPADLRGVSFHQAALRRDGDDDGRQ